MIQRRTFLKGMAGMAGAVILDGCSSPKRSATPAAATRPTVRVVSWTSLGYPSPFTYTAGPGYWRMSLMFDTLLWPDSTGVQLPWLASSYQPSTDGLTHKLQLRDVQWSDGMPVTAQDVAFTYQYYTSQVFTPLLIGVPTPGIAVVPTGDKTVEFRLPQPDATFVQQVLGTMPIVPQHIWSKVSDPMSAMDASALIGTGAYTLTSRDEAQDTESYDARDSFFLGAPWVRRIEMLPADDPLTALRVNQLDGAASAAEGVRNEVLAPFKNNPTYGMITREAGFGFPLFFNISRGGPLADKRFRQACLQAINRDNLVNQLLTGNGTVGSQGFLPPNHPMYNPQTKQYPYDPNAAEQLLDAAGLRRPSPGAVRLQPDGSPLHYTLYIPNTVAVALAELIANNLKAVGIDIDLQQIDLVRLFGIKLSAGYDLLVTEYPGPTGIGPDGDPEILRGIFSSHPPNPFHWANGYGNPAVDKLIDQQAHTVDVQQRTQLVQQIQALVSEDLPMAMLYYTTFYFVFRRAVFDQWYFTPNGFGPGMPDVYNKQPYITGRKTGTVVRRPGQP